MPKTELRVAKACRYSVRAAKGANVTEAASPDSKVINSLPAGAVILASEIRDVDGAQRVRISAPAGWVSANLLERASPVEPVGLSPEVFTTVHMDTEPGDIYGLEFPFTVDMLEAYGAEFLTRAFHAAGTLENENSVVEIASVTPFTEGAAGGVATAAAKAILEVAYERPSPDLHTRLFVKLPSETEFMKMFCAPHAFPEIDIAIMSADGKMSMPVAKYYFGDYSVKTTNSILITECVPYGGDGIEPVYEKGMDHHVDRVEEHYLLLAKLQARLVAAHKTGGFGAAFEQTFAFPEGGKFSVPPPQNVPEIMDMLIDLIGRAAHLYPAEISDPVFLNRVREDVIWGMERVDAILAHIYSDIDYTGLCHPNLNLDNAWFWRDERDELQAGLIDWGSVGQLSFGQAFMGMLFPAEPSIFQSTKRRAISAFAEEYNKHAVPAIDPDILHDQLRLAQYVMGVGILGLSLMTTQLPSEAELKTVHSRHDPFIEDNYALRLTLIVSQNILSEWLQEITPGDTCRAIFDAH